MASSASALTSSTAAAASSSTLFPSSVIFPLSDSFLHHPSLARFLSTSLGASVFFNRLLCGSIFLKHGNHGSPHYRYVWTSEDLQHVYWGDLKTRKIHGSLPCDSLSGVFAGHQSRIFQERAPKGCDSKKCFSLENSQRTLDLEAISEEERDIWVLTFQFLLEFFQVIRTETDEQRRQAILNQAIHIANGEKKSTIISAIEALIEHTQDVKGEGNHSKENDKQIETRQPPDNDRHDRHDSTAVSGATGMLPVPPSLGPVSAVSITSAASAAVSNQSAVRTDGALSVANANANSSLPLSVHGVSMTQPMPYRSLTALANNPQAALAALNNVNAQLHATQSSVPNAQPVHDRSLSAMSSASSALSTSSVAVSSPSMAPLEIYSVAALYQSLEETKRRIESMESDVEKYKDGNKKLVMNSARKMIRLQESIDQLMYENEILRKQLNMPPMEDVEMEQQVQNHIQQQNQIHHQAATQHQIIQHVQRN